MMNFTIDKTKCIQCKLCAQDCPVLIINPKSEWPDIKEGKEKQCIKCQHCLAICPTGALSIWNKKPEDSIPVSQQVPSPIELENLIQTRRSTRKFKKEPIPVSEIHHLLKISAYAPTGHNKNAVLLSVVDKKEQLERFRTIAYEKIKEAHENGALKESLAFLNDLQRLWNSKNIDVVFRDAPHLLIATAPNTVSTPETDCVIALSYFELLANANGYGTLWNGFIKWIIKDIAPELMTILKIPDNHSIGGVLLFGKPAIKYVRSVQSEGLNLNSIQFD